VIFSNSWLRDSAGHSAGSPLEGYCVFYLDIWNIVSIFVLNMKAPKYEPLKMGNKVHADTYGKKMVKYRKWLDKQRVK